MHELKEKRRLVTLSMWLGLERRGRCSTNQSSGSLNGDQISICNSCLSSLEIEFNGMQFRGSFSTFMSVFGAVVIKAMLILAGVNVCVSVTIWDSHSLGHRHRHCVYLYDEFV
jgi:hypothetical protein